MNAISAGEVELAAENCQVVRPTSVDDGFFFKAIVSSLLPG